MQTMGPIVYCFDLPGVWSSFSCSFFVSSIFEMIPSELYRLAEGGKGSQTLVLPLPRGLKDQARPMWCSLISKACE